MYITSFFCFTDTLEIFLYYLHTSGCKGATIDFISINVRIPGLIAYLVVR